MAERKGTKKDKATQVKVEFKGDVDPEVIYLRDLVYKIRESKKQEEINAAFCELSEYLSPKIKKIVGGFRIPGCSFDDILQEAYYALQFKAIKDYNEWKGRDPSKPAAFDHFALLCIRRHLATALKTSKQNRHAAINRGKSLEADHSTDNDEMSLINILSSPKDDVFFDLQHKEYFKLLVNKLWKKLTKLEKQVFMLYANHNTYEEIADIINKKRNDGTKRYKVNIKSVDNSLSRVKMKARVILQLITNREERQTGEVEAKTERGKRKKKKSK